MTIKQQQILSAAALLFSKQSYHGTSTQEIAREAGVSEGLIFRHFTNKEGLLSAIIHQSEDHISQFYNEIENQVDPKSILRRIIELPFNLDSEAFRYWRLLLKLKWELNLDTNQTDEITLTVLDTAFTKLRYKRPRLEAELLFRCLESLFAVMTPAMLEDKQSFKAFLLQKYHIEDYDNE